MRWEDITRRPPAVVTGDGRDTYRVDGYLAFPGLIGAAELAVLRNELANLVEESRSLEESTHYFDLEAGHTTDQPRLRRAACIDDASAALWAFCAESALVEIAADILGPNVRFRDAFANFKWARGGSAVDWHQDLAFYPHTNSGTCQFIVAVEEVTAENGPLRVVAGSHRRGVYSHYDLDGSWMGAIDPARLAESGTEDAVEITGPAGTTSVHHGLTLHASAPNHSDAGRPALVITYASADAIPYTAPPYRSSHYGAIVRGTETRVAHHEDLDLILPPDWSQGYTSIFSHQDVLTIPNQESH